MPYFAVVLLVMVAVAGAVPYANNMEHVDPSPGENDVPTEPQSEEADPDWISWAGAYEGDMMLSDEQRRQLNDSSAERNAVRDTTLLWPKGVIPYQFDGTTFSSSDMSTIQRALARYAQKTCLRFVKRTNEQDYVSIIKGGGCYSSVGRRGGGQRLSLGRGCVYEYIVMHEFMHAAGFTHEQSRYDRDTYVRINYANIKPGRQNNFRKYSSSQIQHLGEPYDYSSLMHYRATAFSKNGLKTIERLDGKTGALGNRVGFSQIDVNKLNKLYSCSGTASTTTTTTASPTTTAGTCSDVYNRACPIWAARNYCSLYVAFMARHCKKSCNKCETCGDDYRGCKSWATGNLCTVGRYVAFMTRHCKKSCKSC